jgi:hypothetical protein
LSRHRGGMPPTFVDFNRWRQTSNLR